MSMAHPRGRAEREEGEGVS